MYPNTNNSRGPSLAHQRNAIKMAFRWWAGDGPTLITGSGDPDELSMRRSRKFCQRFIFYFLLG